MTLIVDFGYQNYTVDKAAALRCLFLLLVVPSVK